MPFNPSDNTTPEKTITHPAVETIAQQAQQAYTPGKGNQPPIDATKPQPQALPNLAILDNSLYSSQPLPDFNPSQPTEVANKVFTPLADGRLAISTNNGSNESAGDILIRSAKPNPDSSQGNPTYTYDVYKPAVGQSAEKLPPGLGQDGVKYAKVSSFTGLVTVDPSGKEVLVDQTSGAGAPQRTLIGAEGIQHEFMNGARDFHDLGNKTITEKYPDGQPSRIINFDKNSPDYDKYDQIVAQYPARTPSTPENTTRPVPVESPKPVTPPGGDQIRPPVSQVPVPPGADVQVKPAAPDNKAIQQADFFLSEIREGKGSDFLKQYSALSLEQKELIGKAMLQENKGDDIIAATQHLPNYRKIDLVADKNNIIGSVALEAPKPESNLNNPAEANLAKNAEAWDNRLRTGNKIESELFSRHYAQLPKEQKIAFAQAMLQAETQWEAANPSLKGIAGLKININPTDGGTLQSVFRGNQEIYPVHHHPSLGIHLKF